MADTVSWVGAITGIASLVVLIYQAGYRWGQLTSKVDLLYTLAPWTGTLQKLAEKAAESGKLSSRSRYRLTEQGRALLPEEFREKVKTFIAGNKDLDGQPTDVVVSAVVHNFSGYIMRIAKQNHADVGIVVGTVAGYVQEISPA